MTRVAVGIWAVNSERMPNESASSRASKLWNMVSFAFRSVTADLHVFVASEFYFANANLGQDDLRWYTRADRDAVLRDLTAISRLKPRLLLAGGSILWHETQKPLFGQKIWRVYNEAPVHYDGIQMKLHRKRVPGGEVLAHDYLRLAQFRGEEIDRSYTQSNRDASNQRFWKSSKDNRSLRELASRVDQTYRDESGNDAVSAPGVQAAHDRYIDRIRYQAGTGEGSFQLPTHNLTAGIEVCMEHSQHDYRDTSVLGATNFHIVTANTVSCHAAERNMSDHTHIADPGLYVHCSAGAPPTAVRKVAGARSLVDGWNQVADNCNMTVVNPPLGI